jgi:two-component system, chemotaxis family, response regulator Rcp1
MVLDNSVKVLLVEDDVGDVKLTTEALKTSKIKVGLDVVNDGEQALDYLRKKGNFKSASTPDLVLLDLNLPKKDGREVLKEIKADELLKKIPVVILSTSDQDADICKSYGAGANCYISKPVSFEEFKKVVQSIEDFWFVIVKLPKAE